MGVLDNYRLCAYVYELNLFVSAETVLCVVQYTHACDVYFQYCTSSKDVYLMVPGNNLVILYAYHLTLKATKMSQVFKVKVGVLFPIEQPGSYWDMTSVLSLLRLEPTEVTA